MRLTACFVIAACAAAGIAAASAAASASAPAPHMAVAPLRPVDCSGTALNINYTLMSLYSVAFTNFEETETRAGRWTLIFEALAALSYTAHGAADFTEALVTMQSIGTQVANATVSVPEVVDIWQSTWTTLGNTVLHEAQAFEAASKRSAAASSYLRAWNYLSLAERLSDHLIPSSLTLYATSVSAFQAASPMAGYLPAFQPLFHM
jgi:hypothetical protein